MLISVDNPNPFVARLRTSCVKIYLKPSYELQCDKALLVLRYSCPRLSASNLRRITETKEKQGKWKCFVNKLSGMNPFPCKLKTTILRDSSIQYFQYQLGEFAGISDILFLIQFAPCWSYVLLAVFIRFTPNLHAYTNYFYQNGESRGYFFQWFVILLLHFLCQANYYHFPRNISL